MKNLALWEKDDSHTLTSSEVDSLEECFDQGWVETVFVDPSDPALLFTQYRLTREGRRLLRSLE